MSDKADPQHGSHADVTEPAPPEVPTPTLAEQARTLVYRGGQSTLATMSRKHAGFPFGSLMPYGLSAEGEPTFLVSSMAMHTRNLLENPRATLLIVQTNDEDNPLGAGRISLVGEVHPVGDGPQREATSDAYLLRNPSAQYWIHFGDFQFFQMSLVDVYFVAGFGVMGWIPAEEFEAARPDPLADHSDQVLRHMNEDHRDSLKLMAAHYRDLQAMDAEMTSIDRLGFQLRVKTAQGMKGIRLAYPHAAETPDEVRQVLVEMVKSARRQS